jgi:hypothetical protein
MTTIPIKFTPPYSWVLTIFGSPPRLSDIQIDGNRVRVRLGWAFHATFDRRDVTSVSPVGARVSVGAHGWRGRWLVNGAHSPIASIQLRAPARGFVVGFPVHVHELLVSVDDVAGLERALASS